MKLESKFTLVLLLTATVPVIMMACFFYGKLYDMVVSYTIRQEQDASAQTSPYIEDLVQQIIDAHDRDHRPGILSDSVPSACKFSVSDVFRFWRVHRIFMITQKNLIDSDMITGITDLYGFSAAICSTCLTMN